MNLINLLIEFEGLKLKAYKDSVGVWTIGIGTTVYPNGTKVKQGDTCTREQAIRYCQEDLKNFRSGVLRLVPATLPSGAIDALTSFAYNLGLGNLSKSTLLRVIKKDKNDLQSIEKEWNKWVYAGGKKLNGLVKRRAKEFELYKESILRQYTENERVEIFKCNYK